MSNARFTIVGRRHGSADIQRGASEAAARWQRDLAGLKLFGLGQAGLSAFNVLRADHARLLAERPTGVAAKLTTVDARNKATSNAWLWIDMVGSVLGQLARTDDGFANEVKSALPDDDGDLATAIPALAALLAKRKADLPEDAEVQARIDEAPAHTAALSDAPGAVAAAKLEPVIDTAEIDLLDGRLYVAIADLNDAGKKGVRHGKLQVPASDYVSQRRGPRKPAPTPEPT